VAGNLIQRPARELQQLREQQQQWQGIAQNAPQWDISRAEVEIETEQAFSADFGGDLALAWDGQWLRLTRNNRRCGLPEQRVWQGQLRKLTLLCDSSSIEIFINDGEAVMSSRYFPVLPSLLIFKGHHQIRLHHWSLANCVLE